jgi:iron(III) transport system substrate-binding protein
MLFMDWYLEEGQQVILDEGLTPSIMPDGSDPLEGLEVVPVDVDQLLAEGQEWSDRWDEIVQNGEILPEE